MLILGISALMALIIAFSHKKRGEKLMVEAEGESSMDLAATLREKAEKESRKSKFWFWLSGLAAVACAGFLVLFLNI